MFPSSARDEIPLNKRIDFGTAELIPGGTPHPCSLLDAIQPDIELFQETEQEKVVRTWLSQLCLDNGFRNFEHELTLNTEP